MVEFCSYTGKWPNLCSVVLTVKIDGEEVSFGSIYKDAQYEGFWSSGGSCFFTNGYQNEHVTKGPWVIHKDLLPEKYVKYADELISVMNEHVRYGCCGGCL